MKPISWAFDVCRDTESGLSSVSIQAESVSDEITRFIASTDTEDRAMDVVNQNWNLASFELNSPILDNHDPFRVVGVGVRAEVVGGRLEVDVKWDHDHPDPSIRGVGHQHMKGIRRAGSVGFRAAQVIERDKLPKDHKFFREPVIVDTWFGPMKHAGLFYDAPELLEFSSATVPMNPEATQRVFVARTARIAGMTLRQFNTMFREATPDERAEFMDLFVDAARIHTAYRRNVIAIGETGLVSTPPDLASQVLAALKRKTP